MLEITDNLFGYIAHKSDMTEDVTKKYQNSLIFIGDENQIYQPLTNTYIGVGYSAFNNLRNSIVDSSHAYQIYVKDSYRYLYLLLFLVLSSIFFHRK